MPTPNKMVLRAAIAMHTAQVDFLSQFFQVGTIRPSWEDINDSTKDLFVAKAKACIQSLEDPPREFLTDIAYSLDIPSEDVGNWNAAISDILSD